MSLTRESDPMLRRFERDQVLATVVMAAIAACWRFDVALGVVGGGLLMAMSYRAIKRGVEAFVPARQDAAAAANGRPIHRTRLAAKFVGRYALLAVAAYVMLTFLRAHPVGLVAGAASPVVAAAIEAGRVARAWSRPGHSR